MSNSAGPIFIYKILPEQPPSPLPKALPLSDLDRKDGYIHLSTSKQVPGTAGRFFANSQKLWLLRLRLDSLHQVNSPDGEVVDSSEKGPRIIWEKISHGVFPHLYDGELGSETVEKVLGFELEKGKTWDQVLSSLEH